MGTSTGRQRRCSTLPLSESLSNEEQKKAFSETVVKVKKNSLDDAGRRVTDAAGLQRLIEEQAALRNLHISLD